MDLPKALEVLDKQALDEKSMAYDNILWSVLDSHAPLKWKWSGWTIITPGSLTRVWTEIILRRKKERTWQQDPNPYSYQAFYNQCRYVSNLTILRDLIIEIKDMKTKGTPGEFLGSSTPSCIGWGTSSTTIRGPKQLANDFNEMWHHNGKS